jgi:hypothetical protein
LEITDYVDAFYILSNGKYLDNWGAYGVCESGTEGSYWMTTVTGSLLTETGEDGPDVTFRTGLCVPKECTLTDMETLNSIFVQSAEFNNMVNPRISYANTNDYMDHVRSWRWGELTFWGIIVAFILLVVIGTAVGMMKFGNRPL